MEDIGNILVISDYGNRSIKKRYLSDELRMATSHLIGLGDIFLTRLNPAEDGKGARGDKFNIRAFKQVFIGWHATLASFYKDIGKYDESLWYSERLMECDESKQIVEILPISVCTRALIWGAFSLSLSLSLVSYTYSSLGHAFGLCIAWESLMF